MGERLFRLAILTLPADFRREFDASLVDWVSVRSARLARRSRGARLLFWSRVLADVARTAFLEWNDRLRATRRRHPTVSSRRRGADAPVETTGSAAAPAAGRGGEGRLRASRDPGGRYPDDPPTAPSVPRPPGALVNKLVDEVIHALRRLARSPGFSALVIGIVAVGLGVNAAIFGVVDAFLFRPRPFEDPASLVYIYQDSDDGEPQSVSYPAFLDMQEYDDLFAGVAAVLVEDSGTWIGDDGSPQPVKLEYSTSQTLRVLGLQALRGRWFEAAEDEPGTPPVAVVSHRTWQQKMGGDPEVVGKVVRLNGTPVTIVGVAPADYAGILPALTTDFWLSISATGPVGGVFRAGNLTRRQDHPYFVVARLQEAVTLDAAQAAMSSLAGRLARQFPELNEGRRIHVFRSDDIRVHPSVDGTLYPVGGLLLGIVGLVLLIVCSNLAGLLLVRSSGRAREIAIRRAVGGTRGGLVRLLLLESLVLAGGGALLAALLAAWALRLLASYPTPLPIPVNLDAGADLRVLTYTGVLAVLTGLAFGIAPALGATRPDVASSLRDPEPGGRRRWKVVPRDALVVAQVAVSLVLLVGAALLLRSLERARTADLGFATAGVAAILADPGQAGLPTEGQAAFHRELLERAGGLPGVASAALASRLPMASSGDSSTLLIEGYEAPTGTGAVEVDWSLVSPGYFETLAIPVVRGRDFEPADAGSERRLAVISAAMARAYYGGLDAVGRRFRRQAAPDSWYEIVGVVDDVPVEEATEAPTPLFYLPLGPGQGDSLYTVARSDGEAAALAGALRDVARQIDDAVLVLEAGTMADQVDDSLATSRALAMMLAVLGAFAMALAALGLHTTVAFAVSRRTTEVGVRMALGARAAQVVGMMVKEVMLRVALGLVLGVGLALLATPALAGLLFGVGAADPATFAGVAVLLAAVSLLASWWPARRAASADPAEALRHD